MNELENNLIELRNILIKVNELFWSAKIEKVLKNGLSQRSLNEILSWYGGMGSFNDILISSYNGHIIEKSEEHKIQEQLEILQGRIYKIATKF